MDVTYSFLNSDDKPSLIPLTQLRVVKDIVDKKIKASNKLIKRCIKIKSNLNKFPREVIKVKSLMELKNEPWKYEKLTHKNYVGLSSVRLTNNDRLIFKESSDNKFIIIEELFHYLSDLDINNLKGTDLELHQLVSKVSKASNINEVITELARISKEKGESKIWFFD